MKRTVALTDLVVSFGNVTNLNKYKRKREIASNKVKTTTFISKTFIVNDVEDWGQVILEDRDGELYKVLLSYPEHKVFPRSGRIKCTLSKSLYFVYWTLEYIEQVYSNNIPMQ